MTAILIFAVLLLLIIFNVPIVVAIGMTAIMFFVGLGDASFLTVLPQRMYAGTTGFTLLSVPFFILAGNLMNTGGITNRIFRFAKAIVGHVPGGLGQVSIISSMIFSGMSGSAVADAAGLGQVQYKAMVDNNYKPVFAASLVASASTIGPVIPPSIPFVIYGALTMVSVSRLFLAGIVPGVLMGVALMVTVALMAKPRNLPRSNWAGWKEVWKSFCGAFFPMMAPVIIIGGILSGIFTPTEASAVVCFYALILGFTYKDLKLKDLPEVFWTTIRQSSSLLFIMAAANFFGWLVIYQRIPDNAIAALAGAGASSASVIWIIIGIVFVLGAFLEGNAIFFITIPLFLPIATMYGLDLVNFGIVMTLLIMIGNLTPPVGMCIFAVTTFSGISIMKLAKECLPYLIGFFIVTIIIAFFPGIATWIPNMVMGP